MALKDKWVDRIDGVDIASANDINQVAQAVIELEETGGGNGADGKSAYDIAVKNGFEGTEAEWLESLKGEDGAAGTRFIAQAEKPTETDVLWLDTDDDAEAPEGGGGTAQPMEKLTFTGAVEAEYDGSEPVTVEIPRGGGGGGSESDELLLEFASTEEVSEIHIPLTGISQKINEAAQLKVYVFVKMPTADEGTSRGNLDCNIFRTWELCSIFKANQKSPSNSSSWANESRIISVITKSKDAQYTGTVSGSIRNTGDWGELNAKSAWVNCNDNDKLRLLSTLPMGVGTTIKLYARGKL